MDHDVFADRERPWRERVEALALELRARLSAHPGAVGLLIGDPLDGPNAFALNERLLQLLADAGLDPVDAARAAYLLVVYVFGSLALEVTDVRQGRPIDSRRRNGRPRGRRPSRRPWADDFPRSTEAAAPMAGHISTEQYLWGLRRILDGIAARRVVLDSPDGGHVAAGDSRGKRAGRARGPGQSPDQSLSAWGE